MRGLTTGCLVTGSTKAWIGGFGELVNFQDTNNAKTTLASAIVSKGSSANNSMTFDELATAIKNIKTTIIQQVNGYKYASRRFTGLNASGTRITVLQLFGSSLTVKLAIFYCQSNNGDRAYCNSIYTTNTSLSIEGDDYGWRPSMSYDPSDKEFRISNGNEDVGYVEVFAS